MLSIEGSMILVWVTTLYDPKMQSQTSAEGLILENYRLLVGEREREFCTTSCRTLNSKPQHRTPQFITL